MKYEEVRKSFRKKKNIDNHFEVLLTNGFLYSMFIDQVN